MPNFKPLCGKICEQFLANVLGKARTFAASNKHFTDKKGERIEIIVGEVEIKAYCRGKCIATFTYTRTIGSREEVYYRLHLMNVNDSFPKRGIGRAIIEAGKEYYKYVGYPSLFNNTSKEEHYTDAGSQLIQHCMACGIIPNECDPDE